MLKYMFSRGVAQSHTSQIAMDAIKGCRFEVSSHPLFSSDRPKHLHGQKHYENTPIQIYPKSENFQIKNFDIFHICVQNIDCGYSLEPPRRGGSNEYPQSMFSAQKYEK